MIDYDEEWIIKLIFRRKGSVAWRACLFALPAAMISVSLIFMDDYFPEYRRDSGMLEISGGQVWSAATASLLLLVGFRAKQSLDRFWEGTGLLHQMRGEWFDAVSCCITFSLSAKPTKLKEVTAFRHTLVRLMSLCHGSALEEIKANETDIIETIDVAGLDLQTLAWIVESKDTCNFNRVELILHMTQTLITKALEDKTLNIPPPILSRVYQTLSRGFVNLLNAKKITDTRFPFPFAQLISTLLLVQMLGTPLMMSVIFHSMAFAAATTFCFVFGVFSINFIASELENPFGNDDNDLPLAHFQAEMNNSLLMLLHPKSDHVAGLSDECKTEFEQLFIARSTAWVESSCQENFKSSENRHSLRSVMTSARRGSDASQVATFSASASGTPQSLAAMLGARSDQQQQQQLQANSEEDPLQEAAAEQGSSVRSPRGSSGRSPRGSSGRSPRGFSGREGPPHVALAAKLPPADVAQAEAPLTPPNRDALERVVEDPSKDKVCPERECPAPAQADQILLEGLERLDRSFLAWNLHLEEQAQILNANTRALQRFSSAMAAGMRGASLGDGKIGLDQECVRPDHPLQHDPPPSWPNSRV